VPSVASISRSILG